MVLERKGYIKKLEGQDKIVPIETDCDEASTSQVVSHKGRKQNEQAATQGKTSNQIGPCKSEATIY